MFANWNSDREHKQQELNLFAEIHRDMGETRLDLERDITLSKFGFDQTRLLLDAIDDQGITAEQFATAFVRSDRFGQLYYRPSINSRTGARPDCNLYQQIDRTRP